MRVKCLAQEHNTMSPARARTRSARSGVERANHEATAPPTVHKDTTGKKWPGSLLEVRLNLREKEKCEMDCVGEKCAFKSDFGQSRNSSRICGKFTTSI